MTIVDVVFVLSDHAKEFVKNYKNDEVSQCEIDAIVVNFTNFLASMYGVDFAIYTKDLRSSKNIITSIPFGEVEKMEISNIINFGKKCYFRKNIIQEIIKSKHMNEIDTISCTQLQAEKIVEDLTKSFLSSI